MNRIVAGILCFFSIITSAQYAAWPASSYSPFYQALFSAAQTPVASVRVAPVAASVLPVGTPVITPVRTVRPVVSYASAPVLAPVSRPAVVATPVLNAPTIVATRVVSALAPFAPATYFIGSNKSKKSVKIYLMHSIFLLIIYFKFLLDSFRLD
uniref:Calphotin-like n=1 Tax=Heterorhabditis bacteriophora TaxID=37862 RepID=A0A1I7XND4_HETBA